MSKHSHYFKDVSHLTHIDIYRIIDLYAITDPCLQHAFKKIACAGQRGAKDAAKDVQEVIDSLTRWQEMQAENHIPDDRKMVYSDPGYTDQDMQAASLVHDALDPALVELCGNTTVHADWIEHVGKGCPLDDTDTLIYIKVASGAHYDAMPAEYANFFLPIGHEERITHWRYAKENQLD